LEEFENYEEFGNWNHLNIELEFYTYGFHVESWKVMFCFCLEYWDLRKWVMLYWRSTGRIYTRETCKGWALPISRLDCALHLASRCLNLGRSWMLQLSFQVSLISWPSEEENEQQDSKIEIGFVGVLSRSHFLGRLTACFCLGGGWEGREY
jgi:hypothetical protein